MSLKKKQLVWLCALGAILLLALAAPLSMTVMAEEGKSTWVWNKEHPKPNWWTWGSDFETNKPVRGGYLRTSATKYIGLMNPNHWPVNDWVAMTYIYEMMIYNDGEFKPTVRWLADSWQYPDPLTCIMKLRKGVKFHDGTSFNAESFKYQIDWIMDKKNGAWSRGWIAPVKSIEVVDEYTVKWHFKKSWGSFLGIMANVPGYVMSKKALEGDVALRESAKLSDKMKTAKKKLAKEEKKAQKAQAVGGEKARKAMAKAEKARKKAAKLEKEYAKWAAKAKGHIKTDVNPVATGKYMLEEGKPGNYLKVKRNPNWWFGKTIGHPDMPYLDGILITVIPDPTVQLANLRAGKIDSMGIDVSQYNLVKNDPNLNIYVYPGNHQMALRFNLTSGPCKDIRIRKAVAHALDRKAIIAGVLFGLGIESSCMYPNVHWGHNPNLKPVSYDPELSKKLLAEAGYSKGLTLKGYMSNLNWAKNTGEVVKEMLVNVGINWEYDSLDSAATSDRMKNLEYDLAQGGWAWILDPDLMATGLFHPDGGFNYGRSDNKPVIELIEKARAEVDQSKRQKMYWEIERLLYENCEDAWLWWPKSVTAFRKNVLGWNHKLYLAGREGFWFSHCRWFKDGHP
ncbi:MAG: ABC transporter substrate-binding protein [Desulfobacteraceae bacterium]|nr:ABC transporter substrate-binding protein [Desulfobacteraceae bacterium]